MEVPIHGRFKLPFRTDGKRLARAIISAKKSRTGFGSLDRRLIACFLFRPSSFVLSLVPPKKNKTRRRSPERRPTKRQFASHNSLSVVAKSSRLFHFVPPDDCLVSLFASIVRLLQINMNVPLLLHRRASSIDDKAGGGGHLRRQQQSRGGGGGGGRGAGRTEMTTNVLPSPMTTTQMTTKAPNKDDKKDVDSAVEEYYRHLALSSFHEPPPSPSKTTTTTNALQQQPSCWKYSNDFAFESSYDEGYNERCLLHVETKEPTTKKQDVFAAAVQKQLPSNETTAKTKTTRDREDEGVADRCNNEAATTMMNTSSTYSASSTSSRGWGPAPKQNSYEQWIRSLIPEHHHLGRYNAAAALVEMTGANESNEEYISFPNNIVVASPTASSASASDGSRVVAYYSGNRNGRLRDPSQQQEEENEVDSDAMFRNLNDFDSIASYLFATDEEVSLERDVAELKQRITTCSTEESMASASEPWDGPDKLSTPTSRSMDQHPPVSTVWIDHDYRQTSETMMTAKNNLVVNNDFPYYHPWRTPTKNEHQNQAHRGCQYLYKNDRRQDDDETMSLLSAKSPSVLSTLAPPAEDDAIFDDRDSFASSYSFPNSVAAADTYSFVGADYSPASLDSDANSDEDAIGIAMDGDRLMMMAMMSTPMDDKVVHRDGNIDSPWSLPPMPVELLLE